MRRIAMIAFWVSSLFIALGTLRILFAPIELVMANMVHYEALVPYAFWAHVIGAPLALALAPAQLWPGLRRRYPLLHRVSGRVYGLAIVIGGVGSLVFLPHFLGSASAAVGFASLGVLWIAFTVLGIARAMQGDLAAHRRWMLRSVALTFAAVTLRVIMVPMMAAGWTVTETYDVTAWLSWIPNLLLVELWLRRGRVRPALLGGWQSG